jgi:class 3 adenylate cyclase
LATGEIKDRWLKPGETVVSVAGHRLVYHSDDGLLWRFQIFQGSRALLELPLGFEYRSGRIHYNGAETRVSHDCLAALPEVFKGCAGVIGLKNFLMHQQVVDVLAAEQSRGTSVPGKVLRAGVRGIPRSVIDSMTESALAPRYVVVEGDSGKGADTYRLTLAGFLESSRREIVAAVLERALAVIREGFGSNPRIESWDASSVITDAKGDRQLVEVVLAVSGLGGELSEENMVCVLDDVEEIAKCDGLPGFLEHLRGGKSQRVSPTAPMRPASEGLDQTAPPLSSSLASADQRRVIDAALRCLLEATLGSVRILGREIRYELGEMPEAAKNALINSCVPSLLEAIPGEIDSYCFTLDGLLEASDRRPWKLLETALAVLKKRWLAPGGRRETRDFNWSEIRAHRFKQLDYGIAYVTFHVAKLSQGGTEAGSDRPGEFDFRFWLMGHDLETIVQLADVPAFQAYRRPHNVVAPAERASGDKTGVPARPKDTPMTTSKTLSILFMDLAGWSKLTAPQVDAYLRNALPNLAKRVQEGYAVEHINTWGDALVATFGSVVQAAQCGLDIRDFFGRASESEGVPRGLRPRISLHVGEVITAYNPFIGREDVFGQAVHLAARLEPVTADGLVFCTKPFAEMLGDQKGTAPAAHEIGHVDLPKGFGRIPVFEVTGPNQDPARARARTAGGDAPVHQSQSPSSVSVTPTHPTPVVGTERIECHGNCQDKWQPPSDFWLVEGRKGIELRELCTSCFYRLTGTNPGDPASKAKRAYPGS